MKTKINTLLLLSFAVYFLFFFSLEAVFAFPFGLGSPGTPPLKEEQSPKRKTESIPGTFDINLLKTPGQASVNTSAETGGVLGFLVKAIDLLVKLIGSVALIVFILGALLTVTSEGKEDRLEKGKTAMLYSLIGLALALFSFLIVTFVQSILF